MKLYLVLYCVPFHVRSLNIAQRDIWLGKPEQAAVSQMDDHFTHQPVPRSQDISWMSQDSRSRLHQVRVHEEQYPAKGRGENQRTSPRFFLLHDSPTAVVYMTYRDDKFHHCEAEQLNTAFGSMFHTVSVRQLSNMPGFLPAGSIGKELLKISDDDLYKLNTYINKEHGTPSEGSVNLAHALLLPFAFPELKYVWIVEDDFVFDGGSIKQLVDFHRHDDADYMPVKTNRNHLNVLKHLRFHPSKWAGSFAPVMRVSAQFVGHVLDEMLEHGFCLFENFFPTVANYYNLKTKRIDHQFTQNVRWMPEWTEEEMSRAKKGQAQNLSIFHPVKANQAQIIPSCSE